MKRLPHAVNPLNETFEVPPQEAEQLWAASLPMEHDNDPERAQRLRISACGQWAIRRMRAKQGRHCPPVHQYVSLVLNQFSELADRGSAVISRAMTPSHDRKHIFTITPWLRDLEACSASVYRRLQSDVLAPYYRTGDASSWAVTDIDDHEQFSTLPGSKLPFLHDADPNIATRHQIAVYGLLRNITL